MEDKKWILWSSEKFDIVTPANPHISPEEGLHVVVYPKIDIPSAWADPELCAEAFELSAKTAKIMEDLKLASWFNLQANGNWGLLPGKSPRFHVHIYARRKGNTWGMPVQLPLVPGTFNNKPMTEEERKILSEALESEL